MAYYTTSMAATEGKVITDISTVDNTNVGVSDLNMHTTAIDMNMFDTNLNADNSTTELTLNETSFNTTVGNFSHMWLSAIHISAITCLFTSAFFSAGILVYNLFVVKKYTQFYDRRVSERFVVYLAICDLLWE